MGVASGTPGKRKAYSASPTWPSPARDANHNASAQSRRGLGEAAEAVTAVAVCPAQAPPRDYPLTLRPDTTSLLPVKMFKNANFEEKLYFLILLHFHLVNNNFF